MVPCIIENRPHLYERIWKAMINYIVTHQWQRTMPLPIRTAVLLGTPSKTLLSGTPELVRGLRQFCLTVDWNSENSYRSSDLHFEPAATCSNIEYILFRSYIAKGFHHREVPLALALFIQKISLCLCVHYNELSMENSMIHLKDASYRRIKGGIPNPILNMWSSCLSV
jgi:hypothetical protein